MKERHKKEKYSNILLILIFVVGLSLLLYPTVSNYWNSLRQSRAVANYVEQVAQLDEQDYEALLEEAREYNNSILDRSLPFEMSEQEIEKYNKALDISGTGIMGYIEIPSIDVTLPIYHGVKGNVLQTAAGHMEWTSLPVGGESTHAVLSGHRGLPSAKLFTNLDKLSEGDIFMLQVLNETLTYEVDQILIVRPAETEALEISEGKDLCTLVTCTPYGINTHRLLVRGHRVENTEHTSTVRVTADAMQIDPLVLAPIIAAPLLLVLLIWVLIPNKKKRNSEDFKGEERQ